MKRETHDRINEALKSLDAYIEYAEKTKRFSDVGFYERLKKLIVELTQDDHFSI